MAYPEPTPVLKGKDARQFLRRLENFSLSSEQVEFYKNARSVYLEKSGKNPSGGGGKKPSRNSAGKNGKNPEVHSPAEDILRLAVSKLVRHYRPSKIYLFGSFARGNPHSGSDLDLLIVKNTRQSPRARWMTVRRMLRALAGIIPISPLVYTEKEIAERLRAGDYFLRDIVQKGMVLYACK